MCNICGTEFVVIITSKQKFCSIQCSRIAHSLLMKTNNPSSRPEVAAKISKANSGEGNPMFGTKNTPEMKKKNSDYQKKRWSDPIFRQQMIDCHSGSNSATWKGGPIQLICEYCGITMIKSHNDGNQKKRHFCSMDCMHKGITVNGEKNPNWRGGITFEPYCPKWTPELRERIRAFFDYECLLCGKPQEDNKTKTGKIFQLHCHHVFYNKQACCDRQEVHFAALCMNCHAKTGHNRERWQEIIHRIIDEIYDGRSYYTKEEWRTLTC
jgi:hypothetical protein